MACAWCLYTPWYVLDRLLMILFKRDAVRGSLFAKSLPVPAIYDAVWDTRSNLITFSSLGTVVVDLFVEQFKKSFDGLRLVPVHPMVRAGQVIDDTLQAALTKANCSGSEAVLEQIEANQAAVKLFWNRSKPTSGSEMTFCSG